MRTSSVSEDDDSTQSGGSVRHYRNSSSVKSSLSNAAEADETIPRAEPQQQGKEPSEPFAKRQKLVATDDDDTAEEEDTTSHENVVVVATGTATSAITSRKRRMDQADEDDDETELEDNNTGDDDATISSTEQDREPILHQKSKTPKATAAAATTTLPLHQQPQQQQQQQGSLASKTNAKKKRKKTIAATNQKAKKSPKPKPPESQNNNNKTAAAANSTKARTSMILRLGPNYQPKPTDVICQRGRTAYEHEGNKRFRTMIADDLATYEQAASKASKSAIVTNVLERIQHGGAFIREVEEKKKKNHKSEGPKSRVVCWYVVEDAIAREKIGQAFRDSLQSSAKAKKSRTKESLSKQNNSNDSDNQDVATRDDEGRNLNQSYHSYSSSQSPISASAAINHQQELAVTANSDTSLAISALVHLASAAQAIPRQPETGTEKASPKRSNNNKKKDEQQKRVLPGKVGTRLEGEPGATDVICGRGKRAYEHDGNARFRKLITKEMERYEKSVSKVEKSSIVSDIIYRVRGASPPGAFVREDPDHTGVWLEVGDAVAREKIGQSFRDLLHTKYSSSTKAKKRKRTANQNSANGLSGQQGGIPPNVSIPIVPIHTNSPRTLVGESSDRNNSTQEAPRVRDGENQTLSDDQSSHDTSHADDGQHTEKLEAWLADTAFVGCSSAPGKQRIQTYAQHFLEEGLHSVAMIQTWCTKADVQTFYWMNKFHKRVFLQNAGLRQ